MTIDRLSAAAMASHTSSFTEYLQVAAPHLLPSAKKLQGVIDAPHGTTIVALATADGMVMAGDRRATMGNVIAQRDIEKVFQADDFSVIGIAGTAGVAIEMVRLLQVELEHYEKIEGTSLSLDGKANRLAIMIRGNLGMAMQGLAVVPLFGGYDLDRQYGRIYSYDVTGGRYEEHSGFHAVGSGAVYARSAMKKKYRHGVSNAEGVQIAVEALYDAADDDSATGGPDLTRNIFPVVATVDREGVVILAESAVGAIAREVIAARNENPGG